jgi:hypothetical protein
VIPVGARKQGHKSAHTDIAKRFLFPTARERRVTSGEVGTSLISQPRRAWRAVIEARSLKQYLREIGIVKKRGQWVLVKSN